MTLSPSREAKFPNLWRGEYHVSSQETDEYNCIAWTVHDTSNWWQPSERIDSYWPPGTLMSQTVEALVAAYESLGFAMCDDSDVELGYEKVAIYGTPDGEFQHAARQLNDGHWTSKLGEWEDIEHNTLEALECQDYGTVQRILRRPIGAS